MSNSSPIHSPVYHRPKFSISHHENRPLPKLNDAGDLSIPTNGNSHGQHHNHLPSHSPPHRNKSDQRIAYGFLIVFILVLLTLSIIIFKTSFKTKGCKLSFGQYKGSIYNLAGSTVENECLLESKWARVARHKVLPFSSAPSLAVISDWLFIDYHDRINVLIQIPNNEAPAASGPQFLLFEQTKYALEHKNSLAVVGGVIEPGELPDTAASREVQEETGRICTEMIPLGRFRTDVNRGMGRVHSYLGIDCGKTTANNMEHNKIMDEVGEPDTERQDARIVTLNELRDAAINGKFLEVQWSNTVALALLHPRLQQ